LAWRKGLISADEKAALFVCLESIAKMISGLIK